MSERRRYLHGEHSVAVRGPVGKELKGLLAELSAEVSGDPIAELRLALLARQVRYAIALLARAPREEALAERQHILRVVSGCHRGLRELGAILRPAKASGPPPLAFLEGDARDG